MGHRQSGRYPCQLVVMVTLGTDETVRRLVEESGRTLSDVLREVVAEGLPVVARRDRRRRAGMAEVAEPAA